MEQAPQELSPRRMQAIEEVV